MGFGVTDHADTIRRLAEAAQREADQVYVPQPPIHTAQQQFCASVTPKVVLDLLARRQQAIDALREIARSQSPYGHPSSSALVARAALVKLGEASPVTNNAAEDS